MKLKEKFDRNSDDAIIRNWDQPPFPNNKLAIYNANIYDNDIGSY